MIIANKKVIEAWEKTIARTKEIEPDEFNTADGYFSGVILEGFNDKKILEDEKLCGIGWPAIPFAVVAAINSADAVTVLQEAYELQKENEKDGIKYRKPYYYQEIMVDDESHQFVIESFEKQLKHFRESGKVYIVAWKIRTIPRNWKRTKGRNQI